MEFDVVAEKLFQRMVSGHRDLVAARAVGRQDGFIGTTQQIRAVTALDEAEYAGGQYPEISGAAATNGRRRDGAQ